MKSLKVLFIVLSILLISSTAYCQNTSSKIKVALDIDANNLIGNRLYSLIESQIRTFNGVEIVDLNEANYEIIIQAIRITNTEGRKFGYSASVLITGLETLDLIKQKYVATKYIHTHKKLGKKDMSLKELKELKSPDEIRKNFNKTLIANIIDKLLQDTVVILYQTMYVYSNLERLSKELLLT